MNFLDTPFWFNLISTADVGAKGPIGGFLMRTTDEDGGQPPFNEDFNRELGGFGAFGVYTNPSHGSGSAMTPEPGDDKGWEAKSCYQLRSRDGDGDGGLLSFNAFFFEVL